MIVITDTHICAPHELWINLLKEDPANTVLIGDIVDIKNTDKKHCEYAHTFMKTLKKMYGDRYVYGNHECEFGDKWFIHEGVMYSHGDWFYYSEEKFYKWRSKKHCTMKWWKRFAIKHKEKFRSGGCSVPTTIKEKIVETAKVFDCHTVVLGHKHPKKKFETTWRGVKIIILPRGRHEL